MLKTLLSFNDDALLIVSIIAISLLVLAVICIVLVKILSKKRVKSLPIASKSEYFEALGGEDNYIDSYLTALKNEHSLRNKEKIKEAGVTGFIEKSDKLTLVVKDNAEEVYEKIFNA